MINSVLSLPPYFQTDEGDEDYLTPDTFRGICGPLRTRSSDEGRGTEGGGLLIKVDIAGLL